MKQTMLCVLAAAMLVSTGFAAPDPMDILTRALNWEKDVKDYTATVVVEMDVPGVEMPTRTAKVYVKWPDKVYVESKGVVVIPKRALLLGNLSKEMKKETKVLLIGTKTRQGHKTYCLKIIPKSDTSGSKGMEPRVLVWVDSRHWRVSRMEILAGATVAASADFTYKQSQGVWMPTKVACAIPAGTLGSDKPGRISVAFNDYSINTGLTDEFFEKRNKQKR